MKARLSSTLNNPIGLPRFVLRLLGDLGWTNVFSEGERSYIF